MPIMPIQLLHRLYTRRLELLRLRARARAWDEARAAARAARLAPVAVRTAPTAAPAESRRGGDLDLDFVPGILRAEAFRNALALGT